jgi:hypothetical protein
MRQRVSSEEVLDKLRRHRAGGCHVDSRLFEEIQRPGRMYVLSLRAANEFFSLVWQSINAARPLVPVGQPRTLRDCAGRLAQYKWSFNRLVDAGYSWFGTCVDIDAGFDYSRFGWPALTLCNNSELQETPAGTYYIYDGVHKSIVLAKKLLNGEIEYKPLEALLLTPRRS